MRIKGLILLSILLILQFGWSQNPVISSELKQKVAVTATKLKAIDCHDLDPLSLNATIVWSQDKTQLAVIMKVNLLHGWHIYSYVPKSQPYITSELQLNLPDGISKIGEWIKPLDEPYNDGVYIYHGELVFIQYCKVNSLNHDILTCGIYYQTCDLNKCYPPEEKQKNLKLKKHL